MSPINPKSAVETNNDGNNTLDVLIIGAGWAGLAAAKELKRIGSVKILEGRHAYGGRCRSELLEDGITVAEHGAQWIHGARNNNPVYRAALEAGVELKRSTYSSQAVYQSANDGSCHRVDPERYAFFYDYLMEGKGGFFAYQEVRQENDDEDVSLRECATGFLAKIDATEEQKLWMEYILESEIVQEYSGSIDDTSMFWWDSDVDIGGGDVEMAQGYQGILEHYVKGIEHLIDYNARVTKIDWSLEGQVTVHYTQNGEHQQITAKRVVITVPLGVLQAKSIEFQPALPAAKQKAIAGIGMGLLNKCLFVWDEKDVPNLPWPQDCEWIERIVAPNSDHPQGLWTEHFNTQPVTGRPVLCCFTGGKVAQDVEQWSDQQIQESAWKSLKHQFGRQDIPEPRQCIITKWGQDEWARGSYTYNNIGGEHSNRKKLAEPLEGKLYFAGEACSPNSFGTTHGALSSGVTAAKQVIGQSKKKKARKAHEIAAGAVKGARKIAQVVHQKYDAAVKA